VNRFLYVLAWVGEVLALVALVLVLVLPIQDYAIKEFFAWREHPSPETYKAYLEKQQQERGIRMVLAVPCLAVAMLLVGPLRKHRWNTR
jgi:hypothetical protein